MTIPNPFGGVTMSELARYAELRTRIEAGQTITYDDAEEHDDDMLWTDAWRGHRCVEDPGRGWYAEDCRAR